MGRRVAIYGKGGIGKSTISSNLTAALSDSGLSVMQVGCDPKHDSTRGLIGGRVQNTVLEYLKETPPSERKLSDIMQNGYGGCLCVEAGGPEPGVGCAGRGIISAFELLNGLGAESIDTDLTLYDVLGDVVCGGFAVPLRKGYADTVYIVTSGEYMAIYAANNILRGTANYDPDRIGGIIFNSRGGEEEIGRVERFSEAVGIPIVAKIPRSALFMEAERDGKTVVEKYPDSDLAEHFRDLARVVAEGKRYAAKYLAEGELEKLILGRETRSCSRRTAGVPGASEEKKPPPYASRRSGYGDVLNGCAFSGASISCTSIKDLTTILHSPKSCAHFTVQLDANSVRGAYTRGYEGPEVYADPDVVCTNMTEGSMIFGGNDALKERILYEVENGKRNLAVITACPPGIIGDAVEDICSTMEKENPGVRIVLLDEGGNAAGDFMQGVIDAGVGLVRKFAIPGEKIPHTVNLVGIKTMSSSAVSELNAVTNALSRLGVAVNCVIPGMTSIGEIEKVPCAEANLMLNGDLFTEKICNFMTGEYGIPTITEPVRGGLTGTVSWLRCVAEFFHLESRIKPMLDELSTKFSKMLSEPRKILHGKRIWVISFSKDVSWIRETLDALGLDIVGACILARGDHTSDLDFKRDDQVFKVIGTGEVRDVISKVNSDRPDIFLSPTAADIDPSIYQSKLPIAPGTDPFAGVDLAYDLARGMLAPKVEGWRRDAA